MANTAQARKRARQAENHRQHNASLRSMVRTYIKKVVNAVSEGNKEQAQANYKEAVPVIDRMANKDLLHKNKASRLKSRLNAQVKKMSDVATPVVKAKSAKPAKAAAKAKVAKAKAAKAKTSK